MTLRNDQVLDVFRELPGHRGSSLAELDAVEKTLGVRLPRRYRELMELDSQRLCRAGIVASPRRLFEIRDEAKGLLVEDGYEFRLQPEDVVFAWDDIYAFYFFRADGTDDPAVMMFNYYDSTFDWKPVQAFDTLTAYFTDALRRYLNLNLNLD
ncbi:SMI1/KNR4 family protein [Novipirellula sp. SH528]|uniref:SMI1/KNR4 family protein n=1 Tax=Novipirellula sp. SH528 TaxID=3454466 RepID=UPI003FA02A66